MTDVRAVADRLGYDVYAEHRDNGVSGAVRDRPEFTAWLNDARRGDVDALLTYHADRLTREGVNAAALVLCFVLCGLSVFSASCDSAPLRVSRMNERLGRSMPALAPTSSPPLSSRYLPPPQVYERQSAPRPMRTSRRSVTDCGGRRRPSRRSGYGDHYPTTTLGRFVAVVLMLLGIALLGVITATIAAWFVERLHDVEESVAESEQRTEASLDEVMRELRELRRIVEAG